MDFYKLSKIYKGGAQTIRHDEAKPLATPMSTSIKLDKDENGKNMNEKLYRDMIGSLLYLTFSRPEIMFSVCIYARF